MAHTDGNAERRGEERSDCELDGRIELPDHIMVACIVKDLSPTGVRIKVESTAQVTDRFDLLVPATPDADQRFKVKLVWRRGDEIGGEFVSVS